MEEDWRGDDLADLAGVPCEKGSAALKGRVPRTTAPRNGGLIIAKTNTPEFGAGSHTFNSVTGTTCSPRVGAASSNDVHETRDDADERTPCPRAAGRSAGGSSGGAAAAVAVGCGMGWLDWS
eukprot:gene36026-64401_t